MGDFEILRFSTAVLPESERLPMLRDFVGPVVARFEIEPLGDGPLHFEIAARAVPDLVVSTLAFSAIRAERTRALTADGNDSYLLSWLRTPENTIVHRAREVMQGAGQGTLLSMADPFAVATTGVARGTSVSVPRKVLAAMVPGLEDGLGVLVHNSEALRLLQDYVAVLDQHQMRSPELRRLAVTHVHDLMALALGASRDAAEIASGRGLRAARLHAIKTDIRASLGEQDLNLGAVAARHGVSLRYVQALFEGDGSTFSQFVVGERLARAHRLLGDPRQAALSISSIAYASGFSDLSYFNRAFRRRYGATPSDIRAAARREQGG